MLLIDESVDCFGSTGSKLRDLSESLTREAAMIGIDVALLDK
jgi:hypothetical protein